MPNRAYEGKGDLDNAISEYEEAIKLKPDDATAFDMLADLCKKSGDLEKALAYYERAAKLAPENSSLCARLGDMYRSMGMEKQAEAAYVKSQSQDMLIILEGTADPFVYDRVARFFIKKRIKPSAQTSGSKS